MQKYGRKSSICFSALLFGPLYFFYRKAWKPAFAFLAVDLLLNLPALLELLVLSESAFALPSAPRPCSFWPSWPPSPALLSWS